MKKKATEHNSFRVRAFVPLLMLTVACAGLAASYKYEVSKLKRSIELHRGDEVEIVLATKQENENNLFEKCRAFYIDRIAVSDRNLVILRLSGCSHPVFNGKDSVEVRDLKTIRKIGTAL